jgi:hypothetical protein
MLSVVISCSSFGYPPEKNQLPALGVEHGIETAKDID